MPRKILLHVFARKIYGLNFYGTPLESTVFLRNENMINFADGS